MRQTFAFLIIFLALSNGSAAGTDCSSIKIDHPLKQVRYCVTYSDQKTSDYLYYFHSNGGNQHSWMLDQNLNGLRSYWKKNGIAAPNVITVSFASWFIILPKIENKLTGLQEIFGEVVLPKIEATLSEPPQKRFLFGYSMGGVNASALMLTYPNLWNKVVLLSPGLILNSPYSSFEEKKEYLRDTGANPFLVFMVHHLIKRYVDSDEIFNRLHPLTIAKTKLSKNSPPTLVTCGTKDEYGFFGACEAWVRTALDRGAPIQFVQHTRGHTHVESEQIGAFLN